MANNQRRFLAGSPGRIKDQKNTILKKTEDKTRLLNAKTKTEKDLKMAFRCV